ncbi:anti-anti-sigma factor [Actinosynnema sp. ALI-1.44]|uniref:STAS domain-containing protein n=1 Tax=Actinosynnema sp. ALI-1.44 TaxID=1933779 RepID=UPI00097C2F6B|nr:STAS domain-containing protein [Actinosynnema sp. ALI-1.44]ONI87865.1 anti-anti-sigma factor [Actinosynnema sp. ALI-1.44]
MTAPLTLTTGHHPDGRPLLTAHGEIDLTTIAEFGAALATAVGDGRPVVVDLTGVDYLDSGAINALFTHADHLHLIVNPLLMSAMTVSGLTTLVTIEQSTTQA